MKIFVINRKKDTGRKEYIINHFKEFSIENYEFVEAVDGSQLCDEFIGKCNTHITRILRKGKMLTKGEIGCALSHLSIYKKIEDEKISGALIFEDDVRLEGTNILSSLKECLSLIKGNNYVFQLKRYESKINNSVVKIKKALGAYAYYITSFAAINISKAYGAYPQMPLDYYIVLINAHVTSVYVHSYPKLNCITNSGNLPSIIDSIGDGTSRAKKKRNLAVRVYHNISMWVFIYIIFPIKFKIKKRLF